MTTSLVGSSLRSSCHAFSARWSSPQRDATVASASSALRSRAKRVIARSNTAVASLRCPRRIWRSMSSTGNWGSSAIRRVSSSYVAVASCSRPSRSHSAIRRRPISPSRGDSDSADRVAASAPSRSPWASRTCPSTSHSTAPGERSSSRASVDSVPRLRATANAVTRLRGVDPRRAPEARAPAR